SFFLKYSLVEKFAGVRSRGTVPTAFSLLLCVFCLLSSTGCRRDMQDQPKMKPYRGTTFFRDGLSARPPVEGTVARGFLRADTAYFTGKKTKATGAPQVGPAPAGPQPAAGS